MKRLALGVSCLLLAACQAADVGPREVGVRPDQASDEAGLWMQADEIEKDIKRSQLRITDPDMNAYVRELTCNVADDLCKDIRIYLIESSSFNAFMMPNGAMVVFSGLMLRADNEAQLASVIGHEIGHFEENHSLEQHRSLKRTALFAFAGDLAMGGLGSLAGVLTLLGYSREHEREADEIGFERLDKAGYSGAEAAKVWSQLLTEFEASDFKRKKQRLNRSSLLETHPAPPERAATLNAKAVAAGPGGKTEAAVYRAKVRPFLDRWLDADAQARDWGMSLHLIARLKAQGEDLGMLTFHEAETYRQRGQTGDDVKAYATYQAATKFADAPARTWRVIAEADRKAGRVAQARAAYETYLKRDPKATDKALIEHVLKQLPAEAAK